ncbi:hypothetical protein DSO57_1026505 [Entomophthora muscae]|uniref:Uncharacterized protein n=1 Tax=Entomophthora muscae TaxID=34485 RepID=A0ACC2S473_9FUNG|nr:hypothetical protein DSO57_1026505 [Entomophthora muscae]
MEPPVTPKPMPASSPNLPTDHSGKLFGIVYITLTGVIDTIIPAVGPWSWVGKSASYLLKLSPLLWWALPAKNLAQVTPENKGLAAQDWIPDNYAPSLCFCRKQTVLPDHALTMGIQTMSYCHTPILYLLSLRLLDVWRKIKSSQNLTS